MITYSDLKMGQPFRLARIDEGGALTADPVGPMIKTKLMWVEPHSPGLRLRYATHTVQIAPGVTYIVNLVNAICLTDYGGFHVAEHSVVIPLGEES